MDKSTDKISTLSSRIADARRLAFNSWKVQCVAAKWDTESLIRDYCLSNKISSSITKDTVSAIGNTPILSHRVGNSYWVGYKGGESTVIRNLDVSLFWIFVGHDYVHKYYLILFKIWIYIGYSLIVSAHSLTLFWCV